ncbi:branched-chain amino acid ABC transporter permease [Candidatus Bathyarchaeota archaeon]|nr:branched-chain amino acid ABC transporter permease [Candidatus Bathyarchaeota archaeon]
MRGIGFNSLTMSLGFLILIGIYGMVADTATTSYLHAMVELMILAYSLNLFTGLSGYANFGHVVFYGLGAYTVSVSAVGLSSMGMSLPTPVYVLGAGVFAAIFALVIGFPILRLRGDYFAIATLGINEAVRVTICNTKELGEGRGIYILGLVPSYDIKMLYIQLLLVAFAVVVTTHIVLKTKLGYGLRAIRADEDVAEIMGVNTSKYKIMAYALGAFFAGLAGGVVTLQFACSFPEYLFIGRSVDMFSAIIIGGIGTLLGPLIGSVIFWIVKDALLIQFPYFHLIIFGVALIVLILFFPRGIVGLANRVLAKRGKVLE